MDAKDILKIKDFCIRRFNELPHGLKLDTGGILNENDRLAIAYYRAVIDLLVAKGLLKDDPVLKLELVEPDSNPPEEDYL